MRSTGCGLNLGLSADDHWRCFGFVKLGDIVRTIYLSAMHVKRVLMWLTLYDSGRHTLVPSHRKRPQSL